MSTARIYRVDVSIPAKELGDDPIYERTHLVEATSPAQAVKHVAGGWVTAKAASVPDVAMLCSAGTTVEKAF